MRAGNKGGASGGKRYAGVRVDSVRKNKNTISIRATSKGGSKLRGTYNIRTGEFKVFSGSTQVARRTGVKGTRASTERGLRGFAERALAQVGFTILPRS